MDCRARSKAVTTSLELIKTARSKKCDLIVMSSEMGVLDIPQDEEIGRVDIHYTPSVSYATLAVVESLTEADIRALISDIDERLVEGQNGSVRRARQESCFIEVHFESAAAALVYAACARGVHQDAPHQLRRHREKVRAIVPVGRGAARHPEIRLVYERGRVERMIRPLGAQPGEVAVTDSTTLVEGVAMGAFTTLYKVACDPLLRRLCQLVMTDEAFERMIRPHGLIEMVRTGEIAIARAKPES